MRTAKIFKNGGSQAVRLPKDFQMDADELLVTKIGHVLLLVPKEHRWDSMRQAITMLPPDSFPERGPQGSTDTIDPIFP